MPIFSNCWIFCHKHTKTSCENAKSWIAANDMKHFPQERVYKNHRDENQQHHNGYSITNIFYNPEPIIFWTISWWLNYFSNNSWKNKSNEPQSLCHNISVFRKILDIICSEKCFKIYTFGMGKPKMNKTTCCIFKNTFLKNIRDTRFHELNLPNVPSV